MAKELPRYPQVPVTWVEGWLSMSAAKDSDWARSC
jgi:hypothetical protein